MSEQTAKSTEKKQRRDDPEKMAKMRAWLQAVAEELSLPVETISAVEPELLSLIGEIAHGPSRPGAPLTAYLVGYAAGQGADAAAQIAQISDLVGRYDDGESK